MDSSNDWIETTLGDNNYFKIISSGIEKFDLEKEYLSTSSIQGTEIKEVETLITYNKRPSRANMQPILNSCWFAKMKDTIKIYSFNEKNIEEINKYILSTGFAGILSNKVKPNLLKYYFLSPTFNQNKDNLASGSTQEAINNVNIKLIPIRFPESNILQQEIINEIEKQFTKLDDSIKSLQIVKKRLEIYRQSILKSGFSGTLIENSSEDFNLIINEINKKRKEFWIGEQLKKFKGKNKILANESWKNKYKEPTKVNLEDTYLIPHTWCWNNLEHISAFENNSLKAGPFGSSLKKQYYVKKGYKIYGQEQVIKGDHTFGDYYIDEERFNMLKSCEVKANDLLISLVGTIGKILIMPQNFEKGIINPRLIKISLNLDYILPKYLKLYLESNFAKSHMNKNSHGGTMNIINLTILKNLPIPICSLQEQQQIVEEIESRFSVIEKVEETVNTSLKKAEQLRKSILKSAFEGKLIKQPVEVLNR